VEVPLDQEHERVLDDARQRIVEMLGEEPLSHLTVAEPVLEYLKNDEIPSSVILELVAVALAGDAKVKYQLLSEPDAAIRAGLLLDELDHLRRLIGQAQRQRPDEWPKGMSWN